jgi:hypothetical protein
LQILAEVDSNNDGVISLEEFLEIMNRNLTCFLYEIRFTVVCLVKAINVIGFS